MKKIIPFLLIVIVAFCFVGCGESNSEYWKAASNAAAEFFEGEEYSSVKNIIYNENLETIMGQEYGAEYLELKTVFGTMFDSAVYFAGSHYNDFQLIPQNKNNKFKKQINKVNKSLKNFIQKVKIFIEKKDEYVSSITFTNEARAVSDIEKARLIKFKREYITLISSAYDLSFDMFEARRVGYHDFLNYEDETVTLTSPSFDLSLAVNASNLKMVSTSIMVAKLYNAKSLASDYDKYWQASNNFYNNVVIPSETREVNGEIKAGLAKWSRAYDVFQNDLEVFKSVVNKIDIELLKKSNYDLDKYAEEKGEPDALSSATYFTNFYKKVAYLTKYVMEI